jgi:hypothetical protein
MGLQVNVGLSKKASENFQSASVSINLVAELDGSLLNRPDELQQKIAKLYALANQAVERQLADTKPPAPSPSYPQRANGHNGKPYNGNGPAPMTAKQRKAILGIARGADVDPFATASQTFAVDFDQLTSRQASELIDALKA